MTERYNTINGLIKMKYSMYMPATSKNKSTNNDTVGVSKNSAGKKKVKALLIIVYTLVKSILFNLLF